MKVTSKLALQSVETAEMFLRDAQQMLDKDAELFLFSNADVRKLLTQVGNCWC
jgi:hypothetical protein